MRIRMFIIITVIVLTVSVSIVCLSILKKGELHKKLEFKDLIQYATKSLTDDTNVEKILSNLELGEYISNVRTNTEEGTEHIYVYYDCKDENNILNYYRECHRISLIQKNSVILFSLIENLGKVTFTFDITDIEFVKSHHLPFVDGKFDIVEHSFSRETINKMYNQDVRNYCKEPDKFMQYKINLCFDSITIYYMRKLDNTIHSIDINSIEVIDKIKNYIETQNFSIPDTGYNGVCKMWLDLNNGYIIGIYDKAYNDYGILVRGNGKEIFSKDNFRNELNLNCVFKILPNGLSRYIEEIIE